jgi:hypothetical protein
VHGEAVAASGGDNDFNAGGFGEVKGSAIAGTDLAGGAEESSVEVDGNEAGRHVLLE